MILQLILVQNLFKYLFHESRSLALIFIYQHKDKPISVYRNQIVQVQILGELEVQLITPLAKLRLSGRLF